MRRAGTRRRRRRLAVAARTAPALLLLAVAGCGGGPMVAQPRPMGDRVASIEVSSGVDVRVVHGRPGVTVHAGRDVVGRVVTETRGDVLHVGVRDRGIVIGHDPLDNVRVQVSLPRLRDVRVDGSGGVDLAGLDARSLTFRVRGAGDLHARGHVDRLVTDIRGAGDARLGELHARTARVLVQGAADVDVNASQRLDIVIRGAGNVTYRGHPRVTQDVAGPGDVSRADA